MSVVKDASMTDISETQSAVEPESLQITKRRKRERVEKINGSSGDSLADVCATENHSGEKNTCVDEAGVDANSKDDSARTQETESITLQDLVMKMKEDSEHLKNLQPTTLLQSQEEQAEFVQEGEKKRKKRKKDECSHRTIDSNDEERLDRITQTCSDSRADVSVTDDTVCKTVGINGDAVDAESKKALSTTEHTESSILQEGGKKKKKKPKKIFNSSQPADLGDGCLEKAHNIDFVQAHISATENTTNEQNACVDESSIDVHSKKGSDITQANELVTSQEEGCLEKIQKVSQPEISGLQKVSQPEISGTGNNISETSDQFNRAEVSPILKAESCTTHTTESATLQKGKKKMEDFASQEKGTVQRTQYVGSDPHVEFYEMNTISGEDSVEIEMNTKSKEVLNSPRSTDPIASQEKQILQRTQAVSSDSQIDISAAEAFIERDSDASEIDTNPTKDMNSSQTADLFEVEEEKKRKKQNDSNCVQAPTAVEEGKRNKKQKKDSISSHPKELDASREEEMLEKISARDSQPGLSAEDNSLCIKHSSIDETEVGTNDKIDATSSQATGSIELQTEGKKKREDLNDSQSLELFESEDGDGGKKKRKKHSQHLDPAESVSHEGGSEKRHKHEQNIACQDTEETHGNKAGTGFVDTNEIMLTQEEKSFCLTKASAEEVDVKEAGFVTNNETVEVSISPETLGKVSAQIIDGKGAGLVSIKETIEVSTSPELNSGQISSNHLGDGLVVNVLNGGLDRDQNTSMKAIEFVSTDSAPSNVSKEDAATEDMKKIIEEADDIDKIARQSSIDHLNNAQASEPLDMILDRDQSEHNTSSLEAGRMNGVEKTTSDLLNGDCAHRESKKTAKTKTDICLDDCSKENIPQAGESRKKQKHSSKDGVITSEEKEGVQADDAVKAIVEVKENSGLVQEQSGSLIYASNEATDKDDCDGKPGIGSIEEKNATSLLKKDDVGLCSVQTKKHNGPTESGTEPMINAGEKRGADSDEDHPSKLVEDVLIGGQAIVHSASSKPVILTTEGANSKSLNQGVMHEGTSPRGNEVSERSSENHSNGDLSDKHCTLVKGLEMTNPSCSSPDVLHDQSKKTTKTMNAATEKKSISQGMIPSKRFSDVRTAKKKLLILDVNGLLVDIIPNSECPTSHQPDLNVSQKSVFIRPYCRDFLRFCFENFAVGVWSSRTWKNLDRVVKFLFEDSEDNLIFCWDQSNCTHTGLSTLDNPNKPLVLKELRRLWRDKKALPWRKGVFDASNTLLLDDSPYKALRNPVHTAIFPHSYKCTDAEDSALGPEGDLRKYLEQILEARNVQEFVSQNPFGQGPITASHPSWPFYRRIIIGE
ncbi:hypothetical protein LINPERPRIM_LOCUS28556 [Linum perenne]